MDVLPKALSPTVDRPSVRLIPPAPIPPRRSTTWHFLRSIGTDVLGTFAEDYYERLTIRGRFLGKPFLQVNDPAGIRHVLVNNTFNYIKPPTTIRALGPFTGDGLMLTEGDEWRGQRRRVAPAFAPAHINALAPTFAAAADSLIRRLEDGAPLDPAAFQAVALDAVLQALFSGATADRRVRLQDLVRRHLVDGNGPGQLGMHDLLARRPNDFAWMLRGRRRFQRDWFAEVDAVIFERRAAPSRTGDLLDGLRGARYADTGKPLSVQEIRSQVATFFAAGFETTGRLLFWAMYLLALDPTEQEQVHDELQSASSGEDASRLPRLRCVLQETLRLYPTAPFINRHALADDVVAGERVRAGDRVSISPWLVHRHRRLWEDAGTFRPERFEGKPNAHFTDDAFIPFSAGPRVCIGASFSMIEAAVVLATLLRRYRVLPPEGAPAMPVAVVTIRPDRPYAFRLVER